MQRGQAINAGIVWGVVIMLVAVAIGGLVFTKIHTETAKQTVGAGTTYSYENTLENAGTATLTITAYDEIKSGNLSGELLISDSVVIGITLNNATIVDTTYAASDNVDNVVTGYLVDGPNSWTVTIDNTARLTAPFITTLSATTYARSIGENVAVDVGTGAGSIFPLLVLIIIIGVFVALIAVLRVLG